eukprot:TRINITY_DN31883_c0_g3_i2.p1 TRINITY_DN31883_c0_g3~~TRINITY_DN31883_c0_g3_i2.p1  ORF type:complete len:530 (-),score=94.00 TRINITY_DN31883_c0_g3_i2:68-1657(-)
MLAIPLTASILGLQPSALIAEPPTAILAGWPKALQGVGEPCLADELEKARPGTAKFWANNWSQMLWLLGASNPSLSAFLLALVLELAKRSVKPEGVHAELLSSTLPMLVPFLAGVPGAQEQEAPPALVKLPSGAKGPQAVAAAILPHFPRLSEALAGVLTKLLCRWSEAGYAMDDNEKPSYLGRDCCELILEALLYGRESKRSELFALRLRSASVILQILPRSRSTKSDRAALSEASALRMADVIAGWLMEEIGPRPLDAATEEKEFSLHSSVAGMSLDDRRRLAFETIAWPLCKQILQIAPELGPRALCFFFFCAVRLPCGRCEKEVGKTVDSRSCDFLREIFDVFVASGKTPFQQLAMSEMFAEALDLSICDAVRGGGPERAKIDLRLGQAVHVKSMRCAARMFVTAWMKSVELATQLWAYELLVKLCCQHLLKPGAAPSAHAWVLSEAIAYRNAVSFDTSSWGTLQLGCFEHARLATMTSCEVRSKLQEAVTATFPRNSAKSEDSAKHSEALSEGINELVAMLPLL